ncbi:MAG: hypothetical protein ACRC33_14805 [Gemmataceae bacterium]
MSVDIVGKAVELWSKWAWAQFTCPRCKRIAGTTMHFGCCGNHICVACFTNFRSEWRGEPVARCPFCRGACGMVCQICEQLIASGKRCTARCCNRNTCEACMEVYCQRAAEAAERTGSLACPLCSARIAD